MKRRIRASNVVLDEAKPVLSAEESGPAIDDTITSLKDDFDYVISGIEKLASNGAGGTQDAMVVAEQVSSALQQFISNIAEDVLGREGAEQ